MKTAYIVGGAGCAFADLHASPMMQPGDGIIVVNDVGVIYDGEPVAWVSIHGTKLLGWMRDRRMAKRSTIRAFTGLSARDQLGERDGLEYVQVLFPQQSQSGSSGLFAVKVALMDLGYDRAILCGVPMLKASVNFNGDDAWSDAVDYRRAWNQSLNALKGKVFSMSGWTKDLLGYPDGADPAYVPDFSRLSEQVKVEPPKPAEPPKPVEADAGKAATKDSAPKSDGDPATDPTTPKKKGTQP